MRGGGIRKWDVRGMGLRMESLDVGLGNWVRVEGVVGWDGRLWG